MRILIFLGVLAIIGLIVTGAITMQRSNDNTITIQIDKSRVKQDAETVVEKGKEVIQDARSALREAARKRQSTQDPAR
jgi:Flp pilus assembly protein TadB